MDEQYAEKIIGSKLPPHHVAKTFFSSGRAAFAYLLREVIEPTPRCVYLPAYMCWSLVSTLLQRFPEIQVKYYPVFRDLRCEYPERLKQGDVLVVVHYFGHENKTSLPKNRGDYIVLEDTSHAHLSQFPSVGDYVFGSLRKILKVADGGYIDGVFYNVLYEPTRKLDTWLRYEAKDWRDVREAENMIDRGWYIADMSAQSLALIMQTDSLHVCLARQRNERLLREQIDAGQAMFKYRHGECPLTHNRLFVTTENRDSFRAHLAERNIFCSIHWPLHEAIAQYATDGGNIGDAKWLADHILCIPVGQDYDSDDMARIVSATKSWGE